MRYELHCMFLFWWYVESNNLFTPQKIFVRPCVANTSWIYIWM